MKEVGEKNIDDLPRSTNNIDQHFTRAGPRADLVVQRPLDPIRAITMQDMFNRDCFDFSQKEEDRLHRNIFIRMPDGLEDPSAADALR